MITAAVMAVDFSLVLVFEERGERIKIPESDDFLFDVLANHEAFL